MSEVIRLPAERRHATELAALAHHDHEPRPQGWALSPRAVEAFIVGGPALELEVDGAVQSVPITRKFYGHDALVQRAIVTLASDRGLLLIGEPGTAKSWLSEHLAAAVCGDSMLSVQGTAGLTEDQIRYAWNYALLLAEGPSLRALVPAPLYLGMNRGRIVRFEEITRAPHEVQDTLLSVLSDKWMAVPELPGDDGLVLAKPGFNIIATANTRDRGVNEMSSALKRRFNFVMVPPLRDLDEEMALVRSQVEELVGDSGASARLDDEILELLVTTFHEIRGGATTEGTLVDRGGATMSTAEAVSVGFHASLHASFFGSGAVEPRHLVHNLAGTAVKDSDDDRKVLRDYFDVAVKPRAAREQGAWAAYWAARDLLR